jgi:hypothetical protein
MSAESPSLLFRRLCFFIVKPLSGGYANYPTKPIPGTLQEGGAPFQTTHWTVVLQAGKAESDEAARKALAAFCEAYWPPLYTFLRRRGYSQADAQDIVQGFFEHLFQQRGGAHQFVSFDEQLPQAEAGY